MVIRAAAEGVHEAWLVSNVGACKRIRNWFRRTETHCMDFDYKVDFYKHYLREDYGSTLPRAYAGEEGNPVRAAMTPENQKYIYTFYVPTETDFEGFKAQMERERDCHVFFAAQSIGAEKPRITLSYTFTAQETDRRATQDCPLGVYERDDVFSPWVEQILESGNLYGLSDCYSGGYMFDGTDTEVTRNLSIYLNRSLAGDEIVRMRDAVEAALLPPDWEPVPYPRRWLNMPFAYCDRPFYAVELLFDAALTAADIAALCGEYAIVSYEYDKPTLDIAEITLFYKEWRSWYSEPYKSSTFTPDGKVVTRVYAEDFTPFADTSPQSTIVEESRLPDGTYARLVQTVSNNDFWDIPDALGLYDYESWTYSYIGIQMDDEIYVAGGEDSYYGDIRYIRILRLLTELLGIYL
ncbi:MAG: hypothetical protein FWF10_11410 [Clostridiales bacterium]|nr:hypothetical protein [Clostridiales bacterium]